MTFKSIFSPLIQVADQKRHTGANDNVAGFLILGLSLIFWQWPLKTKDEFDELWVNGP